MKKTLIMSFNYDLETARLAVFTGHALTPLKITQRQCLPKNSQIYQHPIETMIIQNDDPVAYNQKINNFVINWYHGDALKTTC